MIKKSILKIVNQFPTGKLITGVYSLEKHYLRKEGWNTSVINKLPIDSQGNELPWFTYPSIHFLAERIKKDHIVFEYGSGNSTVWFSKKVQKITSVEHDLAWYSRMKEKFKKIPNITYLHKDLVTSDYQNEILKYDKEFDIIIIDGRERVECIINSLSALKNDGIIIWDNSERERYEEGYKFLHENEFKRIDFWGIGPINTASWCTSIFYREKNCLEI
jgi:precorrin-6B methylase 2